MQDFKDVNQPVFFNYNIQFSVERLFRFSELFTEQRLYYRSGFLLSVH
jgi:hypothetical protein